METQKLKVLFISKHPVYDTIPMAGNQLFNDTLKSFCMDERFDCAFITVQKNGEELQKMRKQFEPIACDFSVVLPKILTPFTYLFYNTRLGIQLAHLNSKWLMLDPIYNSFFKKAIRKVFASNWTPDVIVLEWTEVIFLENFCQDLFPNAELVATEHDVSFIKLNRRFATKPSLQTTLVESFKRAELMALNHIDLVRVLSVDDRNRLVSNGIPIQKISVTSPFFQNKNLPAIPPLDNKVIFYGAMNRVENQEAVSWFIERVYIPFNLSKIVDFVVIGGGKHSLDNQYKNVEGVSFMGYIADPAPIFVKSLCMVVPLLNGGGIKIKVLESMTCSLPVLTNEIGMEGIGGKSKEQFLLCENESDYASAIEFLLENMEERLAIGDAARQWIQEKFNYPKDLENYKAELIALSSKSD